MDKEVNYDGEIIGDCYYFKVRRLTSERQISREIVTVIIDKQDMELLLPEPNSWVAIGNAGEFLSIEPWGNDDDFRSLLKRINDKYQRLIEREGSIFKMPDLFRQHAKKRALNYCTIASRID